MLVKVESDLVTTISAAGITLTAENIKVQAIKDVAVLSQLQFLNSPHPKN